MTTTTRLSSDINLFDMHARHVFLSLSLNRILYFSTFPLFSRRRTRIAIFANTTLPRPSEPDFLRFFPTLAHILLRYRNYIPAIHLLADRALHGQEQLATYCMPYTLFSVLSGLCAAKTFRYTDTTKQPTHHFSRPGRPNGETRVEKRDQTVLATIFFNHVSIKGEI